MPKSKIVKRKKVGAGNSNKVSPAIHVKPNLTNILIKLIQEKMSLENHAMEVGLNIKQIPLLQKINITLLAHKFSDEDKIKLIHKYITTLRHVLTH